MLVLKRLFLFSAIILGLLFCPGVASAQVKILNIGDSIAASNQHRVRLQTHLDQSGVAYDFVGDNEFTVASRTQDINHQGFGGATFGVSLNGRVLASGPQRGLVDVLDLYEPDVILVLSGYNHLAQEVVGGGLDATKTQYAELVDFIFANSTTDVQVLFSNVTDFAPNGRFGSRRQNVVDWNQWLANDIVQRQAVGEEIYLVDNFSDVDYRSDLLGDGLHVNSSGLNKIGDNWYAELLAVEAVPEPSALTLLCSLSLWGVSRRRRR